MLDWFLADGRIVLFALAILLVEIGFLRVVPRAYRIGFLANAVAGIGLLGALYAAINGMATGAIAAGLALGLAGHLAYLATLAVRK